VARGAVFRPVFPDPEVATFHGCIGCQKTGASRFQLILFNEFKVKWPGLLPGVVLDGEFGALIFDGGACSGAWCGATGLELLMFIENRIP